MKENTPAAARSNMVRERVQMVLLDRIRRLVAPDRICLGELLEEVDLTYSIGTHRIELLRLIVRKEAYHV